MAALSRSSLWRKALPSPAARVSALLARFCGQGQQPVAGVNCRAAAVDFIHAAAADGAAQAAGFLFELVPDRQYAFLDDQLIVRGVEVAVQIEKLERRRAMGRAFIVKDGAVRFAGLVADDQLVGADATGSWRISS
nr:Uncharacterised protein [Raoultella sp. NCTC 9187]